jgi:hypothetical protein
MRTARATVSIPAGAPPSDRDLARRRMPAGWTVAGRYGQLPMALPNVALLPTCHVMLLLLQGIAPPISTTAELLAVISVLLVLNSQPAFGFPPASSVRVPVRPPSGW